MQTLTRTSLQSLFKRIVKQAPDIFGEFQFSGIRILVKKPKLILGRERSKRLYESRRSRGLCVHCGAKVKEKNPYTRQAYRLCARHRQAELERKKIRRRDNRSR